MSLRFIVPGIIALGVALHLANVGAVPIPLISGAAVGNIKADDTIRFIAKVIELKMAKDGRPLPTVEADGGIQLKVYIADDARCPGISYGARYEFTATALGPGMVIVHVAGGVKKLGEVTEVPNQFAYVFNQVATIGNTMQCPAPLVPDGPHTGRVVYVGSKATFVL